MYAYLEGEVVQMEADRLILDNHGIGYEIAVSAQAMTQFQLGQVYRVYTKYVVREDGVALYGFYDREEKQMFELLTRVSAIGPKSALSILSALPVETLRRAILLNDLATLTKAPGIGKKTAGRICLELFEPLEKLGFRAETSDFAQNNEAEAPSDERRVAVEALVNLGYARNEAEKAVNSLPPELHQLEEIVRNALRALA